MIKRTLIAFLFVLGLLQLNAQEKPLLPGMKITASVKIKKGIYLLDGINDPGKPVILIEGDGIVVDFNEAELKGSKNDKSPDEFNGVAILVRNSKKVTVRNLKARGYKIAFQALNVEQLVIENCDFSYNYRQHLNSTQEKEDISDWMSYHHNEKDEWLRYGAALYLRNCNRAIIRNCKVTGGQNALMMTACNDGKIYNNDFSFNSGIGLGMYRCNRNEVLYNRINFNVRGYSHGVYNRGQDSAGILVYEQSNNNIFYKNSVTHGGDGFFLWAGQTTMDTGEGGCNDNLLMGNDFSFAPTNGIEVTFSRNRIAGNRIFECDHGIWGGYSFSSLISGNQFRDNRVAIAIEHGQHNTIISNLFSKDKEAIKLWSRKQQPADWGYAKYRDTRSADYTIALNSFNYNPSVINITGTDSLKIFGNTYSGSGTALKTDSSVTHIDSSDRVLAEPTFEYPTVNNPIDPFTGIGKLAGRKNILITEWGPYDFRSPVIWNSNPTDTSAVMKFDLLGPKGKWVIKNYRGVKDISARNGIFPATITANKIKGERTDIFIELEYTGESILSPFGEKIAAGKPFKFSFRKFFQPVDWTVKWFPVDSVPVKGGPYPGREEYKAVYTKGHDRPIKTATTDKLDYAWWGGIKSDNLLIVSGDSTRRQELKQYTQFVTIAEGKAELIPGNYELGVTWDDMVRVYIDDKLVIEEWNPSRYTFDESPHKKVRLRLGGTHRFRVEHVELGGFACLSLKIKRIE